MKIYLLSLGAGLLVGVVYSLLQVRSPAPPLVALIGLLGILVGEQIVPVGKQLLSGTAFVAACDKEQAVSHVLGQLPGRQAKHHPGDKAEG
ncbi:XapX domain-containing protein [Streptomyces cavourensis]|jgi:XapX domain-containing protein|uniref:XapX domain-containing protein n=1 Tax=unclassified Achromobacter TaxID=2626865 RepID=UPI000DFFA86A|nr:XapX domain-containing protein [Streptomyces cavourensis]